MRYDVISLGVLVVGISLCGTAAHTQTRAEPAAQTLTGRSLFAKIPGYRGSYSVESYLPQITNGPNYPTWSPDGTQIAFAMRGSIWRIKRGDTTAVELTHGEGYDSQPAWSPDGKWVAYTSERNEQIHLKLLNLEDGSIGDLTSGASINVEPEWSPDGKRLAYVSTAPDGRYHVYLMPVENGVAGQAVALTRDFRLEPPTHYYGEWAVHIHPTWTRDGSELILVSNRDNKHGSGGFYRMRAEPGAPMTRFYYEETTWKARPSLSPDGAKLVYSSYLGRQWQQLWTIPPSGGYPFPLTYGEFDRTTPRWSPDGSRIAFISNETGDTSLWLFHWFGGKLEPVRIERLAYKQPMGTLRVRVLDQATGQPMAARVHLKAADARTYAPAESWLQVDRNMFDYMDTEPYRYFHTDGEFTVTLPVGRATLAVSKGFEWLPAETEVTVDVQKAAAVEVALKRLDNLQAKGWWNGNNHFHMNYAGAYRNTPEHLMLQGSAEGIHVLNNLICNKEQRIPDIAYFTGKPDPVSTDRQILYHNQEYHPPFWGHAVFLRLRRHLVIPDYVGYQETSVASLYPTNTTAFEIARAQGALAGYAHGAAPGPVSSRGAHFPVDLALGTVDFVEANSIEAMDPLYRAWNTGFRVVASAGEDAFPNFSRTHILGSNRVYVKTDQQSLDYDEWVEAFGAGRAFVTTGPLVFFTVNGLDPGDELRLPAGTHSLRVQADVQSITPIETIELLRNGQVVVTQKPAGRALKASVDTTVSADRSGWYAVRVRAQAARHPLRPGSGGAGIPFAATMPVWVIVDNQPVRSNIDAAYFMDWMDKTLERAMTGISVSNEPTPWNNEQEKEEVRQLYAQARALMQQRAQLAEAPSSRQQDQAIAQATIVEAQGAPAEVRPAPIHLALDEGVEVGSLQLYSQARAWMQQRAQLAEAPSSRQQDQAIAQATIVEARGAPAEVRPAPIHLALDEGVEVGSLQLYSQARAWMQQRAQLAEAPSSRQQDQAIAQATIVEAQGAPAEVRPAPIHLALDEGVEVGSLSMTIRFPSKLVTFQNVELGGVAEGMGAEVQAELEQQNDEGVVHLMVAAPEKDGVRAALPDGPLVNLRFRIGEDAKPGTVIPLTIVAATATGTEAGGGAVELGTRDGQIVVSAALITACFFYMH